MKRILIKLSGEVLSGEQKFGLEFNAARNLAKSLKSIREEGFEIALVVGGGNIFRGINLADSGLERTPADQMGMLATLINGVGLKNALEQEGMNTRLVSALECPRIAETYQYDHVMKALSQGETVIFAGGTGNPYFTTDTAAALRAAEIKADFLVKATKVDGVYDKDPKAGPAVKFDTISYNEFLSRSLKVMDQTAVQLAQNAKIPVLVCNMKLLGEKKLQEIIGNKIGTLIQG